MIRSIRHRGLKRLHEDDDPRGRANWRVIFRFEDRDAFDVDYVDYH
jgi:hypothetical protein